MARRIDIHHTASGFCVVGDGSGMPRVAAEASALDLAVDMGGEVTIVMHETDAHTSRRDPDAPAFVDFTYVENDDEAGR